MNGRAVGVAWGEFARASEIATAGQRLLEDAGIPGVAFLSTVGADGTPRIHPFIPAIVNDRLWAFVIESPKQRDLDRTGAYAIHSMLGADDESFFVAGTARRVDDEALRAEVAERMPFDDIDEHHLLYEFTVTRALRTTWTTPTQPVHHRWACTP